MVLTRFVAETLPGNQFLTPNIVGGVKDSPFLTRHAFSNFGQVRILETFIAKIKLTLKWKGRDLETQRSSFIGFRVCDQNIGLVVGILRYWVPVLNKHGTSHTVILD